MTHYYYRVQRWNAFTATWNDVNCFSTLPYALSYLRLQMGIGTGWRILRQTVDTKEEIVFARYTPEQGYEYLPEER